MFIEIALISFNFKGGKDFKFRDSSNILRSQEQNKKSAKLAVFIKRKTNMLFFHNDKLKKSKYVKR